MKEKWLKTLKNKKKKKGSSVIEFAFGLLIFVLLAGFASDIIVVANKQYVTSQTANELVRQVSIQGGLMNATPKGFPGGHNAYTTSSELFGLLNKRFKGEDIKQNEWELELVEYDANGFKVSEKILKRNMNFKVDYRSNFDINIKYKYKWKLMGNVIPTMKDYKEVEQKRSAVSEFKYNYNDWAGERE